jgi:uncharacterized protein (TIGR03084 family)
MQEICDDLAAEHGSLDALVADLDEDAWARPTPAEGWAVRDQISHLGYFDRTALLTITQPDAFKASIEELLTAGTDVSVEHGRHVSAAELLAWWREGRARLLTELRGLDPKARLDWYGPPLGARSFATARLMETWAHGQDVADALGVVRPPTDRLRHVAHLGVQTRSFSYVVRGLDPPSEPVAVELTLPSGEAWTWGDPAGDQLVSGPALDFCLVVTQRRHVADTELTTRGALADEWLHLAQAYAGPAGPGRPASPRGR